VIGAGNAVYIHLKMKKMVKSTQQISRVFFLIFNNVPVKTIPAGKFRYPDARFFLLTTIDPLQHFPGTCAYRLLATGQTLAWWHPLISGTFVTVHQAGISVKDKAISET
jgi:hypothetical protein